MRGWNGVRTAATAVLVVAGLVLGNTAYAAPKAKKSGTSTSVLQKLHQATELLKHADHDYDGHLAKALHESTMAMKELLHHKHLPKSTGAKGAPGKLATGKAPGGKKGTKTKSGNKESEPQAVSDKQLHEALTLLHSVVHEIPGHHAAHHHVEEAIGNLHTALKIK